MGVSYWSDGKVKDGIDLMKKGIDCKYSAVRAVQSLHTIYSELFRVYPTNFHYQTQWADILCKINRSQEAAGKPCHVQNQNESTLFLPAKSGSTGARFLFCHIWNPSELVFDVS